MVTDIVKMEVLVLVQKQTVKTGGADTVVETVKIEVQVW